MASIKLWASQVTSALEKSGLQPETLHNVKQGYLQFLSLEITGKLWRIDQKEGWLTHQEQHFTSSERHRRQLPFLLAAPMLVQFVLKICPHPEEIIRPDSVVCIISKPHLPLHSPLITAQSGKTTYTHEVAESKTLKPAPLHYLDMVYDSTETTRRDIGSAKFLIN